VVKLGVQPIVKSMAGFASGRELCRHVVGIGGCLKIRRVAGDAGSRKSLELPHCCARVAGLALDRRVRTEQRETVLVLADGLCRDLPAAHRMAAFAVRAHLAAVQVGVTVGAVVAHIGEHGLDVALRAGDFLVQAAERVAGGVVIEFRDSADGAPARVRVAIFTRDGEGAMRTPSGGLLRGNPRSHKGSQYGCQNPIPPQINFQSTAPELLVLPGPVPLLNEGTAWV